MTGSYNNFFKIFDRRTKRDVMYEANKEIAVNSTSKSLNPRKVCSYCAFNIYLHKNLIDFRFVSYQIWQPERKRRTKYMWIVWILQAKFYIRHGIQRIMWSRLPQQTTYSYLKKAWTIIPTEALIFDLISMLHFVRCWYIL